MYEIKKDGVRLSLEDELRYVKTQPNGVTVYCGKEEAEAVEINNSYNEPIEGLEIIEFNGAVQVTDMEAALERLGYEEEEHGQV